MEPRSDLWALRNLERATRFQDWLFSVVAPSALGPGVEAGAGIGSFSSRLLAAGIEPLLLLEPEADCADELERRFAGDERVAVAREGLPGSAALAARAGRLRYALCSNVLEHIEDDGAALRSLAASLVPLGEVVVLVPAGPRLFGRLDRELGHHRRYTRASLRSLVGRAGLELVSIRSFNLLGVPGWWLAGRTSRVGLSPSSLRIYDAVVRFWRPVEELLRPKVGLSLVARARRPAA
jgi:hypothetical protein